MTFGHKISNSSMQHECPNMLMICELLMAVPFTNAKLERMFSCMARVKINWRNSLGWDWLDALLRIGEDSPEMTNFDSSNAMMLRYNDKVWRLTAGPNNYPKSKKTNAKEKQKDISTMTLSNVEGDSDTDVTDFFA